MRAIPTQAAICHSSTTTLTCRTYNLVEPGKGNALHTHPSVEIFIALDGKWEIAWGGRGEHTTVLQPWDMIAVPAHVRHSYKNVEEKTANHIMTILCGDASITWGPDVVAEARNHGVRCTRRCCFTCAYRLPEPRTFDARCSRRGELLGFWSGEELQEEAGAETEEDEPDAYHRPMSNAEMARHVRRFRDGQSLSVQAKGSFVNVSSRDKRPQHRVQLRTDPASSRALAGLLACTGSRRDAGDSLQSPRGRCAPGGARGFPLADASGWRARGRHIAARLGARVCGRGTRHPGVQPASHAVHDTRRRVADAGDRRPPVRRMDRCRRFPDVDDGCAAVAPSPSSLVIWSRIEAPRSGSMGGECFAPVEEAWRAIGARGGRKERRIASATFKCRLPQNGRCAGAGAYKSVELILCTVY